MFALLQLSVLVLASVQGQQTPNYCTTLAQCRDTVTQQDAKCKALADQQKAAMPTPKPQNFTKPSDACFAELRELRTQLEVKVLARETQRTECIRKGASTATLILINNPKQLDQCDKKSANVSTTVDDFQLPQQNDQPLLDAPAVPAGAAPNSAGASKAEKEEQKRKQQAEQKQKQEQRKAQDHVIQECRKSVQHKSQPCGQLGGCCSATKICEEQYELSDLHDQVHGLQLQVYQKSIECAEKKAAEPTPPPHHSAHSAPPPTVAPTSGGGNI